MFHFLSITKEDEMNSKNGMWVGALFVLLVVLTGCNTLEGAGKDVERAGEEVQDVAK